MPNKISQNYEEYTDFLFCSFYDVNLLIFNNEARHVMLAVYKVHSTRQNRDSKHESRYKIYFKILSANRIRMVTKAEVLLFFSAV